MGGRKRDLPPAAQNQLKNAKKKKKKDLHAVQTHAYSQSSRVSSQVGRQLDELVAAVLGPSPGLHSLADKGAVSGSRDSTG